MPEVIWIITTCLQKDKETSPTPTTFTSYAERGEDYKRGIPSVLRYRNPDERVFLTENTGHTSSWLDDYGLPVHYTNTQQEMFHANHGKKEFTDIVSCLNAHAIADDAMVIKVTGRYVLQSNAFAQRVRENLDKDVVYSPTNAFKDIPPHPFPDCILGMIAMKARHWRSLPLESIRDKGTPTEWFVAAYITSTIPREQQVCVKHLDLAVKIGSSRHYWTV